MNSLRPFRLSSTASTLQRGSYDLRQETTFSTVLFLFGVTLLQILLRVNLASNVLGVTTLMETLFATFLTTAKMYRMPINSTVMEMESETNVTTVITFTVLIKPTLMAMDMETNATTVLTSAIPLNLPLILQAAAVQSVFESAMEILVLVLHVRQTSTMILTTVENVDKNVFLQTLSFATLESALNVPLERLIATTLALAKISKRTLFIVVFAAMIAESTPTALLVRADV